MGLGDSIASMRWCGRTQHGAQCCVLSAAVCSAAGWGECSVLGCAGVLCDLGCACGWGGTAAVGFDDAGVGLAGRK